jgi:hypothetical protein
MLPGLHGCRPPAAVSRCCRRPAGESEVQRLTTFLQSVILNPDTVEGKARARFLSVEVRTSALRM